MTLHVRGGNAVVRLLNLRTIWYSVEGEKEVVSFLMRLCVPDVSADGDHATAMANYVDGSWTQIGGPMPVLPFRPPWELLPTRWQATHRASSTPASTK